MADRSVLDGPFFDDGHRALAREFEQWAEGRLPVLLDGDAAGAKARTALERPTP